MATGAMLAVGSMAASVVGSAMSSGGGGSAGTVVQAAGSAMGSASGGGFSVSSGIGMMTDFGKSVFSSGSEQSEAAYNSQMSDLRSLNELQGGVYNRDTSYKEAQLVRQDADIKLAALRRELYRREHSLGGYKGVRLDSGSIVDVKEDTIRQANHDAEVVKYQADIAAGRYESQGDMSLWSTATSLALDKNDSDHEYDNEANSRTQSLIDDAETNLTSLIS
ncbi:hypothetical protein [Maridesulfovibrio frigidus]|uniref:hypothetical protein n=1 Tax=Maridesulfovibrio frigidus TaxID=340956 RepID=UPI00068B9CD9|nr:hypothetical protein [Maridesulfovibrio frigidus]